MGCKGILGVCSCIVITVGLQALEDVFTVALTVQLHWYSSSSSPSFSLVVQRSRSTVASLAWQQATLNPKPYPQLQAQTYAATYHHEVQAAWFSQSQYLLELWGVGIDTLPCIVDSYGELVIVFPLGFLIRFMLQSTPYSSSGPALILRFKVWIWELPTIGDRNIVP